jgi:hypothetical protein
MKELAYRLSHDRVEIADSRLPPPVVTYSGNGRWRLEAPYTYTDGETAITIPASFDFDLSSVPRIFWPLVAPFELSIVAPLVHDFLCRYTGQAAGRFRPAGAELQPRGGRCGVSQDHGGGERLVVAEDDRVLAVRGFGGNAWGG